jgi:hypothetical protein
MVLGGYLINKQPQKCLKTMAVLYIFRVVRKRKRLVLSRGRVVS